MQQLLQQATHYMQLGQFGEAIKTCKKIISSGNNHPQLHMIMAIAYGQTNKLSKSKEIFNKLIQHFPTNPEIYYNLALILEINKSNASAIVQYKKCIQVNPVHFSALNNLGILELKANHTDAAIAYFKRAVECQPTNIEYIRNLGHAYYQAQDYVLCETTLMPIIGSKLMADEDFVLILDSLYKNRNQAVSDPLYKKALHLYPNNAEILNLSGLLEMDNKKYKLAKLYFSKAVTVSNENLEYKLNQLTATSHLTNNSEYLLGQLKQLEEQYSSNSMIFEYAANLCENLNLLKDAKYFAKKGLELDNKNAKLLSIIGKIHSSKKKYNKALKWLKNANNYCTSSSLKIDIAYEKSKVLDKQTKYKKAWAAILSANQLNKAAINQVSPELQFINQAKQSINDFKDNYSLQNSASKHHHDVVFIIGFPRSGTTLVERILSAHPKVKILEETNAINDIYQNINQLNGSSFFQKLKQLNTEQVNQLQQSYFNGIHDYIDWNNQDTIVDKMPMNVNHLALINKIFPNAKILLTIRHPYDVCISCLMQDMLQVFSFGSAAQVYDAYMQIFDCYNNHLNLDLYQIKYEDLVADKTTEINNLIKYLGLSWHNNLEKFYKIKTLTSTPSYQQVNQDIYQQAKYRYKNYLPYIKNDVEPLNKWLKYYHYYNN